MERIALRDPASAAPMKSQFFLPTAVDRIEFSFDGSDKGTFGLNTPAYFAMDDFTVTAVPEPTSLAAVLATVVCGLQQFRSRRRHA